MLTAPRISIFLIFMFLGTSMGARSQQFQFIHIQSEGNRPFNVELSGKNYPSSLTGYLVIPQLAPGKYMLQVSFPQSSSEYVFECTLTDKPLGFTLKQEVDNSWSLFDLVDFTEKKGMPAAVWREQKELADKEAARAARQAAKQNGASSGIKKIYDRASSAGIDQVYVVMNGNRTDTIALFIPVLETKKPDDSGALGQPALPVKKEMHVGLVASLPRRKFI